VSQPELLTGRPDVADWIRERGHELPDAILEEELRGTLGVSGDELIEALDLVADVRGARNGAPVPDFVGAEPEPPALRFAQLEDFAAQAEVSAEPLLGSTEDMVLAAGGTLLLYGDGGTSKTTLTIDAVLHLAAGEPWLGLPVPRPLSVLVIENEGPRGPFRAKLERKLESWTGAPFAGRVHVLEEPWARFSFAEEGHRAELAAFLVDNEVDLIVCGPLAALGAVGGGTPEEVSAFEQLLVDLRRRSDRPLAIWIAHHENKAGDVSGAWERLPDTLVHVRLEGRQRTSLHWRKARWSSALHGERWTLAWETGREGFTLIGEEETAAAKAAELEDATLWVLDYVSENPGASKSATEAALGKVRGKGGRALARRAIEAELTASTPRLAKGSGKSPNGIYLYPASEVDSPLAAPLFGEHGEQGTDPESGPVLANSPPPRRGGERDGGEQTDGVAEPVPEFEGEEPT
jgi:hypothetical protein